MCELAMFIPVKGKIYCDTVERVVDAVRKQDKDIPIYILTCDFEDDTRQYMPKLDAKILNMTMEEWSRSTAFNLMYWTLNEDYLIFNDADIAPLDNDWIDKIKERIQREQYFINYDSIDGVLGGDCLGGSCTIDRKFLTKTGGMDCRMKVWGYEDIDYMCKVRALNGWREIKEFRMSANMTHIKHETTSMDKAFAEDHWYNNRVFHDDNLKKMKKDVQLYIKENPFLEYTFLDFLSVH